MMARAMLFPPLFAAFAGVLSVLFNESGGYGMGMHNYSWGTNGILTQLWGLVFTAPAIGFGYQYLRSGKRLAASLLLVFLGCGSHLLSVHLIGFSLGIAALVLCSQIAPRVVMRRLGIFALGCAGAIAHQLVTLISDLHYVHQSILEPTWKFSSHGLRWTYDRFMQGELFDLARYPVLSLLVMVGIALCLFDAVMARTASGRTQGMLLIGCFGVWLSLLVGYDVWGWLFTNLPVFRSMHMHRFIVGVHLFGALLGARALYEISCQVPSRLLVVLLFAVVMYPVLKERKQTFDTRHQWIVSAKPAPQEQADLDDLISVLRASPRGWVYAGFARDWGHTLKVAQSAPLYHSLLIAGIPSMGMLFHPFGLAGDVMFDFDPMRRDRYDLFGFRYVVAPLSWQPPPFLKVLKEYQRYVLYEYPEGGVASLGKLSFEGWGTPTEVAQAMRRWIALGVSEKGQYGEIGRKPTGKLPGIFLGSPYFQPIAPGNSPLDGRVTHSSWTQHRLEAKVTLNEPALVVFKVGFHPGWRIAVDGGRETSAHWVTPGFLGVELPAGEHLLVARYAHSKLKGPLFLLSLAVLGALSLKSSLRPIRRLIAPLTTIRVIGQ
jgi:hypothetical protein